MFDLGLLPPSIFDFVVISDTHHRINTPGEKLEFRNHALQAARAGAALKMAAALDYKFCLHLGDMCQEHPGTRNFDASIAAAKRQFREAGLKPLYHVAGNQDIGDKPDPTMPTKTVSREKIMWFHKHFGRSWYAFEVQGVLFLVLNSMLLNGDLPERHAQREWLLRTLRRHRRRRKILFLHIPLYIADRDEAVLGHYENIGEPDRSWLLKLIKACGIEQVVSGHTHFSFFDSDARTRFRVLCSPAMTRTGFSYVLHAAPPPERGRDDRPKLGFYLFRVMERRVDVHFVRTAGIEGLPKQTAGMPRRLVTRLSSSLKHSPLGATFVSPLATQVEAPLAWPSIVRERIRNDYPLLLACEWGLRHARAPLGDFSDELLSKRLAVLRREGVALTAIVPALPSGPDLKAMTGISGQVDGFEIQWLGATFPDAGGCAALKGLQKTSRKPISISTVVAGVAAAGKGFPQHRIGYLPSELDELGERLRKARVRVNRVALRLPVDQDAWDAIGSLERSCFADFADGVDWLVSNTGTDDAGNALRAAECLFAARHAEYARLFLEPFVDLDRSMDEIHGVLDTHANPREMFEALRALNSALFFNDKWGETERLSLPATQGKFLALRSERGWAVLFLPRKRGQVPDVMPAWTRLGLAPREQARLYRLSECTAQTVRVADVPRALRAAPGRGALLIVAEAGL